MDKWRSQVLGLRVHEVDGLLTLEETAELVAQPFALYLEKDDE